MLFHVRIILMFKRNEHEYEQCSQTIQPHKNDEHDNVKTKKSQDLNKAHN